MKHYTTDELSKLLISDAPAVQMNAVYDHLDECPECKERYTRFYAGEIPECLPLSVQEKDQLFEAILEKTSAAQTDTKIIRFPWYYGAAAALSAAALLVLSISPVSTMLQNIIHKQPALEQSVPQTVYSLTPVNGPVTINGATCNQPVRFMVDSLDVRTTDNSSVRLMLTDLSCSVENQTTFTIAQSGKTIAIALHGEFQGTLAPHCGKHLSIRVTGGTYHIVGTIFHIWSSDSGSAIDVTEGTVVYTPDSPEGNGDTISAGEHKSFLLTPSIAEGQHPGPSTSMGIHTGKTGGLTTDSTYIDPALPATDESQSSQAVTSDTTRLTPIQCARILIMQGELDSAIACLTVLAQDKTQPEALALLGWALEKNGKAKKSVEYYIAYLNDHKSQIYRNTAYQGIVNYYFSINSTTDLKRWLNAWVAEMPQTQEPVFLLATLYQEKGDFQSALRYFEDYILKSKTGIFKTAPWLEESMFYAARCHKQLKHEKEYAQSTAEYRTRYPHGQFIAAFDN